MGTVLLVFPKVNCFLFCPRNCLDAKLSESLQFSTFLSLPLDCALQGPEMGHFLLDFLKCPTGVWHVVGIQKAYLVEGKNE